MAPVDIKLKNRICSGDYVEFEDLIFGDARTKHNFKNDSDVEFRVVQYERPITSMRPPMSLEWWTWQWHQCVKECQPPHLHSPAKKIGIYSTGMGTVLRTTHQAKHAQKWSRAATHICFICRALYAERSTCNICHSYKSKSKRNSKPKPKQGPTRRGPTQFRIYYWLIE